MTGRQTLGNYVAYDAPKDTLDYKQANGIKMTPGEQSQYRDILAARRQFEEMAPQTNPTNPEYINWFTNQAQKAGYDWQTQDAPPWSNGLIGADHAAARDYLRQKAELERNRAALMQMAKNRAATLQPANLPPPTQPLPQDASQPGYVMQRNYFGG